MRGRHPDSAGPHTDAYKKLWDKPEIAMCKIVRYWYTCNHSLRLRQSRCGGTKHKRSRSGPAPACKGEPCLSMIVPIDCGPCQHLAFEERWRRKLFRAELFLDKLKEKGFPGIQEVAALIEQLKDECNAATWESRSRFPHAHKDRTERVNLGHFVRRPSPLPHEVFREDICEPSDVFEPNAPDCEYDWDYVASTDPLHPVDTNYTHPLDDVDPSWMLNHLSREEFERTSSGVGFDPNEVNSLWSMPVEQTNSPSTHWDESSESWSSETTVNREQQATELRPKHEVLDGHKSAWCPTIASTKQDERRAERIAMVFEEFWSLVNDVDDQDQPQDHDPLALNADPFAQLNALHISDSSRLHKAQPTAFPTPPQTPPRSPPVSPSKPRYSAAPPSDTETPPLPVTKATTDYHIANTDLPSPNSTRGPYNKLRQHFLTTKNADKARFYRDWLELSRCEIRDAEGVNGRFVQNPQVPLQLGAKNGWWR